MVQELFMSVASGIIVAIVLGLFRRAPQTRHPSAPSHRHSYPQARPRRGSFFGGLLRFIFSIAGGIGFAFFATNALHMRHYHRYNVHDAVVPHAPLLMFTVIGTVVIWLLLSALTRR